MHDVSWCIMCFKPANYVLSILKPFLIEIYKTHNDLTKNPIPSLLKDFNPILILSIINPVLVARKMQNFISIVNFILSSWGIKKNWWMFYTCIQRIICKRWEYTYGWDVMKNKTEAIKGHIRIWSRDSVHFNITNTKYFDTYSVSFFRTKFPKRRCPCDSWRFFFFFFENWLKNMKNFVSLSLW